MIEYEQLIQNRYQLTLQGILNRYGHFKLREIAEAEIMLLEDRNSVIATGGSAVYSEKAVNHLKRSGRDDLSENGKFR